MVKEIETKKEKLKRTKKPLFILFVLVVFVNLCGWVGEKPWLRGGEVILILLSFFILPLIPIFFAVFPVVAVIVCRYNDHNWTIKLDKIPVVVVSFIVLIYSTYLIFSKQYEFPYTFKGIYNILKS